MTLLHAGSVTVRNSVFPARSSCAGSHPDVCVCVCFSLRRDEDVEEPLNQSLPPGGGSSVCGLLWIWKMDNLTRTFITRIPTGGNLRSHAELIHKCPAVV